MVVIVTKTQDQRTVTLTETRAGMVMSVFDVPQTTTDDPLNVGERMAMVILTDKNRAELKKWL